MMLCETGQTLGPHPHVFGDHRRPDTPAMKSTTDGAVGTQTQYDRSTQAEDEVTHSHIGIIFATSAAAHELKVFNYFTRIGKQPKLFPCDNSDLLKSSLETLVCCTCLYLTVDEEFFQLLEDNYMTYKKVFNELNEAERKLYLINYLKDREDFNEVRYKLPKEFRNNLVPKEKFNELTFGQFDITENDNMAVQIGQNNQIEFDRSGDVHSTQIGGNSYFHCRSDASIDGYVLTIKTPESNHWLDASIKKHIDDNKAYININLQDMHARIEATHLGSVIIEVAVDRGAKIGPVWLRELITRILSEDIFALMPEGTRMELVIRASIPLKPLDVNIFDAVPIMPHRYPLELSPEQIQYLKESPPAKEFLLKRLESEGITCEFDLEECSIGFLEQGHNSENRAQQILKGSVFVQDVSEHTNTEDFLSTYGSSELRPRVVKVGNEMKLVGIADVITIQGGHADSGVSIFDDEEEKVISVDEECLKYFRNHKWTELTASVHKYQGVTMTAEDKNIKLQGPLFAVGKAAKRIKDEMARVKSFEINLGPEINVAVVAQVAREVGQRNQCTVTYKQHLGTTGPVPVLPESNLQTLSLRVSGRKDTKVNLVMSALECQKAHVIVNTTNTALDLNQGKGVTSCIFKAAGPTIQTELKKRHPGGIQHGEVAESGPGNIKTCRTIYHGALPEFPKGKDSKDYNEKEGECFKWLVSLVFNCLIKASSSEKGYRTIAFPALGTGFLEYPVQHVVQLMYKAIRLYNDDERSGPIREVIIVIHPDTKLTVKQLFLAHRLTHQLKSRHIAAIGQIREEMKQRSEIRVHVGSTLLQVAHGNIHEASEVSEAVLVLWTDKEILNPDTNLLLKSTNPNKSDWKCSAYVSELAETKCTADSTSLPGTMLIHSYCKNDSEKAITDAIAAGLQNASEISCNTITIPLVSGGHMAKTPEAQSSGVIINAVTKAKTKIFVVTVVIPNDEVFVPFATKAAAMFDNKLQEPADIDKSPVAVDLWEKTFAGKASASKAALHSLMTMSSVDSTLLITSDSEEKNKMVAQELQSKLSSRLPVKLESP